MHLHCCECRHKRDSSERRERYAAHAVTRQRQHHPRRFRRGHGGLHPRGPVRSRQCASLTPKLLLSARDTTQDDTIVTVERIEDGTGACVDANGVSVAALTEADCLAWTPDGPGEWTPNRFGMMTMNGNVTFGSELMPARTLTVQSSGGMATMMVQVNNLLIMN